MHMFQMFTILIGIEINEVKSIETALLAFCSNGNRTSVGFQRHAEISTSGRKHRFRRIQQSRHSRLPHCGKNSPRLIILNFGLFRDLKSIVDLDTQVFNG